MSEWSAGYVSDVGYTYGYYQELNPLLLKTAMLHAGLSCPDIKVACELGFGQGLNTNFHAAATKIKWYGTDFNPAQASFAREMAQASGSDVHLYDDSFEEFCSRKDLPDFDYIGLHGIWSWVSDENRQIIVDFIRRKLKVGGVVYVSYNTLPGWAGFGPMRHLMTQHAEIIGSEGSGIVSRIDGALEFADNLLQTNPLYAAANPNIGERLKKVKEQNRHYLAHEYFNKDWDPMHFATFAQWVAPAKVDFGCSAYLIDHFDTVNMDQEQKTILNEITNVTLHQSTRDFIVNQQFRRDYWVKGLRQLSELEKIETLQKQEFLPTVDRASVSLKVQSAKGEATMNEDIYNPILDVMANFKPVSVEKLHEQVKSNEINFSHVIQSLMVLASTGQVRAIQDMTIAKKLSARTDKLNDYLIKRARSNGEITHLVSPVVAGGVQLTRFEQLFTGLYKQGVKDPTEIVKAVWHVLKFQNQVLIKEGQTLQSDEDNVAELMQQANEFINKKVPILKSLLIL